MNRRDFLKFTGISLLSLTALTLGCGNDKTAKADAPAPEVKQNTNEGASQNMSTNSKKILVAYFSWSGNTKAVAEEIHKQVGGDIVEIVPATPYSETYSVTVAKARQSRQPMPVLLSAPKSLTLTNMTLSSLAIQTGGAAIRCPWPPSSIPINSTAKQLLPSSPTVAAVNNAA